MIVYNLFNLSDKRRWCREYVFFFCSFEVRTWKWEERSKKMFYSTFCGLNFNLVKAGLVVGLLDIFLIVSDLFMSFEIVETGEIEFYAFKFKENQLGFCFRQFCSDCDEFSYLSFYFLCCSLDSWRINGLFVFWLYLKMFSNCNKLSAEWVSDRLLDYLFKLQIIYVFACDMSTDSNKADALCAF